MARYAKDMEEIDDSTLVKWNGQIYGVWDSNEHHTVRLIPWDILISHDGDESLLEQSSVTVPIRQIQLLEPVEASQATVRALFRLDKMPWDLAQEGLFPFSSATHRYPFTEDDLLCLIDRLPMFKNGFLFEAWEKSFFTYPDGSAISHIEMPAKDQPGFTFAFLAERFFSMMDWFDPKEEDWKYILELRDCYLQSKGKSLSQMAIPEFFRSDMLRELEEFAKDHPVTEEIRSSYETLLKEELHSGESSSIKEYAYAYYGGNDIVPCDWRKAEQALLMLFDPETDPPAGDPSAANSLGYIYGSDRLGAPDWVKAFRCFRYGAAYGAIESTYKLSDLYRKGLGTEPDPQKAWTLVNGLYQRANKHRITGGKFADILLRMGYCYRDGIGVQANQDQALHFFLEAKRAIEARIKKCPEYGDHVVARNIDAAIESVRATPHNANGDKV